jgi:hypothetical protein
MNKTVIGAAVLIFAVVLAVVLGTQLSGQAAAIAFGVAIGVLVGVPAGVASAAVMLRRVPAAQGESQLQLPVQEVQLRWDDIPAEIMMLTPDQAQALITLLEQPAIHAAPPAATYSEQSSAPAPAAPPNPASRSRDISVVGGADLSQSFDE